MSTSPHWSLDTGQAQWVKDRLLDPSECTVTSLVPEGFEAYARILHPVENPRRGDKLVRWRDVAEWSGVMLTAHSQWLTIAMPEARPAEDRPWKSQGPATGALYPNDALVLVDIAKRYTATRNECWCCVSDNYGWWSRFALTSDEDTGDNSVPGPIPKEAQDWPKVHVMYQGDPYRSYLLYKEDLDGSFMEAIKTLEDQTPNIWWPSDRAWCIGTEIHAESTYVGGSQALIDEIVTNGDLETFEVSGSDPLFAPMPDWMLSLVSVTVEQLLTTGRAEVETSIGNIHFDLDLPSRLRRGQLVTRSDRGDGSEGSSETPIGKTKGSELSREIEFQVRFELESLAN